LLRNIFIWAAAYQNNLRLQNIGKQYNVSVSDGHHIHVLQAVN